MDDLSVSAAHAKNFSRNRFLQRLYGEFYKELLRVEKIADKTVVELGSNGDFIKRLLPRAITSNVLQLPYVDMHFSAIQMPFAGNSVDVFFAINVFHHLVCAGSFLGEIHRCLKAGGRLIMIEPANTPWGGLVSRFHHEDFDPRGGWSRKDSDSAFSSNLALAWIVFQRDRARFLKEFPSLRIKKLRAHTPFAYLLSGGVTKPQLLPDFTYNIIKGIEFMLVPFNPLLGTFLTVVIEKTG